MSRNSKNSKRSKMKRTRKTSRSNKISSIIGNSSSKKAGAAKGAEAPKVTGS